MPAKINRPIWQCQYSECRKGGPLIDEHGQQVYSSNGEAVYQRGRWPKRPQGDNKYCDLACYGEAKRGQPMTPAQYNKRMEKTILTSRMRKCARCGAAFEAPRKNIAKVFCSDECVNANRRERYHPPVRQKVAKIGLV